MHYPTKKALIIGCGLGGATLALFLKRAGIEAEIYETRTTSEGYSLTLSSNGLAVLQELGLARAAIAAGSVVTRGEMWNGKGKPLGKMGLASSDLQSIFVKRVPLGQIISDEVERQGIKIFRGKKLQDLEVTPQDGVVATFQDSSSASGDLLIGADGVHSRTRQVIHPTFPRAVYTGLINSGGYTPTMKLPSAPETVHFIFCKRAFFGYHISASGYVYWFTNWPQAEEPTRDAFENMTDAPRRREMLEIYKDDQPFIRQIIQGAEETFPYFSSYTLPKQPTTWHKGPVVLLGDAAHAITQSSGQGASMALEDAIVLAKCLRDIPNLERAFATHEHLRRERTVKMHAVGKQGDAGKHMVRPMQQFFRDLTTPIFFKLFITPKAVEWMYSYRVDWATKVETTEPAASAQSVRA